MHVIFQATSADISQETQTALISRNMGKKIRSSHITTKGIQHSKSNKNHQNHKERVSCKILEKRGRFSGLNICDQIL